MARTVLEPTYNIIYSGLTHAYKNDKVFDRCRFLLDPSFLLCPIIRVSVRASPN
jgi:hypothetical protein